MSFKPSIPKGTRDFGPLAATQRNYIFESIRKVFELHGFRPLETPAMENLSTLTGKYGDEGDKLLFRILNSGNFLAETDKSAILEGNHQAVASQITEKGLRYDLTVPFARFVVQHQNEIVFPFKRYQIQPVWRADRPQKGRYREFYQCDADIIGSTSLVNEFEMIQLIDHVFEKLGINTQIHINNRKVLFGIAESFGLGDRFQDFTVVIDKLDKIGSDNVKAELTATGIDSTKADAILELLAFSGCNREKLAKLETIFTTSETGRKGLEEMQEVFEYISNYNGNAKVIFDISLARGLNYYTGAIFEVKAIGHAIGSICGGGRYDNLTGIFGLPNVSGVGISFGADRIFDIMEQSNLFPEHIESSAKIMFVNFGKTEQKAALEIIATLHKAGISAFLYPDTAKMKKQLQYADQLRIEYIAIIGEDELKNNNLSLKNMHTGEQTSCTTEELIGLLK